MDFLESFLKLYGPLGLGWPLFIWITKSYIQEKKAQAEKQDKREEKHVESTVRLAVSLEALTTSIKHIIAMRGARDT